MTVCNFYPRGACKFGDNCKFEHPGSARDANRGSGNAFGGGSNANRFNAFSGDRYRPGQASSGTFGASRDAKPSYSLDQTDIKNDMTGQRPIYPLSCYGPGKDAPRQLIEGPVEISPEELRLRYYTLRAAGNEPQAQQEEAALGEKMKAQVDTIVNDIPGAIRYVEEGANVHPNRLDIVQGNATNQAASGTSTAASNSNPFLKPPAANPFSSTSATQGSAFGQASTPGFGRPAFGQPAAAAPTTSAFGQPSNPGQATSAFGQASGMGQKPSPFGQPSALGGGQPSALGGSGAFGKPAFGASGFGQASMPGQGSAFGQTSSMGQGSAFGKPSAPGAASGFGQTNALGQKPAFGQSGFGQASQPGANASPFTQQAQSKPNPFGQQAQTNASPFGQQTQSTTSPFGQQNQQTQPTTQPSPFGQQTQQTQQPNPFQQAQTQQPAAARPNPFGGAAASQTPTFGQPGQPAAANPSPFGTAAQTNTTTTANPFQQATAQKAAAPSPFAQPQTQSQPATSPFAQQSQPAAPAAPVNSGNIDPKDRFKEGTPDQYEGEKGKFLEEIYTRVSQLGRFNDDEDIPLVPPKCEWIVPVTL